MQTIRNFRFAYGDDKNNAKEDSGLKKPPRFGAVVLLLFQNFFNNRADIFVHFFRAAIRVYY
jgi:hypothetical protein